ncbi:hypothetical protein [Halosimplex pelagicum]|uniref:Uncharacterized protein n=1 Tax=Halosimplex pelagicum TaxID=869886 RepID=A0A7D5TVQ0_9EURY|nr:hypothetical protein [Halosimplex pelagicum]QLH83414.1 hypothetical protein HZS54_18025 [Halosimplex pelagicum]
MNYNDYQRDVSPAIADRSDQEVGTVAARTRDSIERSTDQLRPTEGSR